MSDMHAALERAATALETAHAQRDRAVLEAHAAGMGGTAIAAAVRLSRMQVHRIIVAEERRTTAAEEPSSGA